MQKGSGLSTSAPLPSKTYGQLPEQHVSPLSDILQPDPIHRSGKFQPPGAVSIASFVYEYDKLAAELRAEVRKPSKVIGSIPDGENPISSSFWRN
jgi:hypothetical protein